MDEARLLERACWLAECSTEGVDGEEDFHAAIQAYRIGRWGKNALDKMPTSTVSIFEVARCIDCKTPIDETR